MKRTFAISVPWNSPAPKGAEQGARQVSFDAARNVLTLAADPLGIVPLHYFSGKEAFVCSDDLDEIERLAGEPLEISPAALRAYMEFQHVPYPYTIWKGVLRVPPGHALDADLRTRTTTLRRTWIRRTEPKSDIAYPDACKRLREIMQGVVRRSMPANPEEQVGVLLSGGLDSSVIAALVLREMRKPLVCVTVGSDDPAYDETERAAAAVRRFERDARHGIRHVVERMRGDDFELLPQLIRNAGQPYADASMLPTFLAARKMKEFADTAFCGDAADEMYGGYERYQAMRLLRASNILPRPLWRAAASLMPDSGERTFAGRARRFLRLASLPDASHYRALMTHFASDELTRLAPGLPDFEWIPESGASDYAERFNDWDIRTYLPGDAIPKMELCSSTAGLHVLSPFADMESVEFSASLPFRFKQRGRVRKRILADAFRDMIPAAALGRKRGFGVPLASLFRSAWRERMRERVLDDSLSVWFDRKERERLADEHLSGARDHSCPLFSLIVLSFWLEMRKKRDFLLQKSKTAVN